MARADAFGPLLWQPEADTQLTMSASPTAVVGEKALFKVSQICDMTYKISVKKIPIVQSTMYRKMVQFITKQNRSPTGLVP